ncbi:hypothetical protein HID58_074605 [Brassica napus]|uniref:Uncharacterized protein n=1 Tax=Brassica napus TaxID=3708 RepID=A0ABQ7YJZ4_BRANA|nr:hypothetical protein HID58_074605 [Brassica napus]
MLSCKICGKKYNKNCICFIGVHGVVPRAVFVRSVEFVCCRTGDPNKFVFCKRCDAAYHCQSLNIYFFFQIPNGLLQDCKSLQNLSLHNNPISMDEFRLMEGLDLEDCPEKELLGHGLTLLWQATRITIPDFIT